MLSYLYRRCRGIDSSIASFDPCVLESVSIENLHRLDSDFQLGASISISEAFIAISCMLSYSVEFLDENRLSNRPLPRKALRVMVNFSSGSLSATS